MVELALPMAGDDAGDDACVVSVRVDAVELRGFYERGDRRPVFATALGAGEERVLAIEGLGRFFDDGCIQISGTSNRLACGPGTRKRATAKAESLRSRFS